MIKEQEFWTEALNLLGAINNKLDKLIELSSNDNVKINIRKKLDLEPLTDENDRGETYIVKTRTKSNF